MPPRIAALLPAALPLRDGVRMLEIGTGDGTTILQVAQWGSELGIRGRYVGLDREPTRAGPFAAAAAAAGVGGTTEFACFDAFQIGMELGRFDVVLCFDCLSQFVFEGLPAGVATDSVERRLGELFAHWGTLLVPGGMLVIADTDRDVPGDAAARAIALFEQERWPLLPGGVVAATLGAAGFDSLLTRSSLRKRSDSRAQIERLMGAGRYRRLPRGNFPPPPYPPRVPEIADGIHELTWRVVRASVPAEGPPV
jgi:SAM-dependent methyltransferase